MFRRVDKMQLFYFPTWLMILLFFILWGLFQTGAASLCRHLPDRYFAKDNFLYRERKFEKSGLFYQKFFRIRRWKHFLPDGAAAVGGYKKRHLTDFSEENLQKFLLESRRAELTHWLAIPCFWIFGLFSPFVVVPLMFFYALAINLPCIVAQRYNRPRVMGLLQRKNAGVLKKRTLDTVRHCDSQ